MQNDFKSLVILLGYNKALLFSIYQTNNKLLKKIALILLLYSCYAFSTEDPKVIVYNHGQNGMELVAKSKNGTIIISTFNAKMTIRQDIARKIYDLYKSTPIESNSKIKVKGEEACVTGKCVIRKKKDLVVIDFYYQTVEWNSGQIEIYKKP